MNTSAKKKAFESFVSTLDSIRRYAEQNLRIVELFAETDTFQLINPRLISELSEIMNTHRQLAVFSEMFSSLSSELAGELTSTVSIERLLSMDTVHINAFLRSATFLSNTWTENLCQSNRNWRFHLLDASKFATLSQTLLSQVSWEQIGNALDVQDVTRNSLQSVLAEFSQSYSGLLNSWARQSPIMTSLPPVISRLSTVEFFNGMIVVDAITFTTERDAEFESEKQQAIEEVRKEAGDRLEFLLSELDPRLITMLHGARQSLASSNPDHVRHFSVSLRELFTHVLHTLAPDDKVKRWSESDKGRPTRKARLLYISRTLRSQSALVTFIEKDVDAALVFLQLLQRGTHKVASDYTAVQLEYMLVRMESLLRYLLEIWYKSKNSDWS